MKTLEKERAEARRQLELATTKSDRDGVLTWVVPEEGATVQKGAVLARIADLNSFRVHATVSDIHAGRLSVGLPVSIKINEDFLEGRISSIVPTIKDGVMTLLIALKEKASSLLKSNLRVDVLMSPNARTGAQDQERSVRELGGVHGSVCDSWRQRGKGTVSIGHQQFRRL